jgi:hypothetical protein
MTYNEEYQMLIREAREEYSAWENTKENTRKEHKEKYKLQRQAKNKLRDMSA